MGLLVVARQVEDRAGMVSRPSLEVLPVDRVQIVWTLLRYLFDGLVVSLRGERMLDVGIAVGCTTIESVTWWEVDHFRTNIE